MLEKDCGGFLFYKLLVFWECVFGWFMGFKERDLLVKLRFGILVMFLLVWKDFNN